MSDSRLIAPYGGKISDCSLSHRALSHYIKQLAYLPKLTLNRRQQCDVELILNGAFSPLTGFLDQEDYHCVLTDTRLANGMIWPIPIVLDVSKEFSKALKASSVVLQDNEGVPIAILSVSSIWQADKALEAMAIFGSDDISHPGVHALFNEVAPFYLGGQLHALKPIQHYDFLNFRLSPAQMRQKFEQWGWHKVIGFQSRHAMHRLHHKVTLQTAHKLEGKLLIQPVIGQSRPEGVEYFTRVQCYEHILQHYPKAMAAVNLLPLAMRFAGPREALWDLIISQNYGCSHFIVGPDHAGAGEDLNGVPYYEPYAAQALISHYQSEIAGQMVPLSVWHYVRQSDDYKPMEEIAEAYKPVEVSGTQLEQRLQAQKSVPEWAMHPEVVETLKKAYPDRSVQGFTLFFTGLSGAGKSTLANAVMVKLLERTDHQVTLLDGDLVRQNLSSELTFSREHRDLNIQRIGFVAAEIVRHGGVAICAPIAPYQVTRDQVRAQIEAVGGFIEIYVSTPLDVCEQRDRKGLYQQARSGKIQHFTGISDPYEAPLHPEVNINTEEGNVMSSAQKVLDQLEKLGFIRLEVTS